MLLVDNRDSYTYNLYQLIASVTGQQPLVVTNDDPGWDRLDLGRFEAAVISPGPGRPDNERDFGHSRRVLARPDLPVLGVCLGHQGIGLFAGARVEPAPRPRHGHLTRISHHGRDLFADLPPDFTAVRYHSLCLAEPLPDTLEVLARAEDGVVMAVRHRRLPRWGVQFHPESIGTEYGARLLRNFHALAARPATDPGTRRQAAGTDRPAAPARRFTEAGPPGRPGAAGVAGTAGTGRPLRVHVAELPLAVDTEAAFERLYGSGRYGFWLDSGGPVPELARFSFLGDPTGPLGRVLSYRVGDGFVRSGPVGGPVRRLPGGIFDVLAAGLAVHRVDRHDLPFDFVGGYVGYFGYELKADCGATNRFRSPLPDAMWLYVDRFVAVDHREGRTWLVALSAADGPGTAAEAWLADTRAALRDLGPAPRRGPLPLNPVHPERWLVGSRAGYLADIAECQRQLELGESYEICLTGQLRLPAPADDLGYYRRLRRTNPAPYGALLKLGDLAVFSSSPERFLRIGRDRTVESRPIKGTAPRDPDPRIDGMLRAGLATDPKTRAENLMIVDLLRNDLGRVCEIGSVEVPGYLVTETYATVHQLVSTVRGRLARGAGSLDCVRACFPGGSMTGAPKLRTMEIIDRLEAGPRGVYAGALGYLGPGGAADLSVVIRTAVRSGGELTIGAGGAIVLDSVPAAEYAEMVLKAQSTLRALPLPTALPDRATRAGGAPHS